MRDLGTMQFEADEPTGGELKAACEHVARELVEGVRHGFFEMTITVETVQSKKKSITVRGGKSYRFTV